MTTNFNPCPKCHKKCIIAPVHVDDNGAYVKPFCAHCRYEGKPVKVRGARATIKEMELVVKLWNEEG
jgi:hypothetical protein